MEFSAEFVQEPPVRNYDLREEWRGEGHTLLINEVNEVSQYINTVDRQNTTNPI
jgi:hypothetical protein